MYLISRATSAPSDSTLSHGAIAGIVVAVVAFTAIIIVGIRTYLKRRSIRTPLPSLPAYGGEQQYYGYTPHTCYGDLAGYPNNATPNVHLNEMLSWSGSGYYGHSSELSSGDILARLRLNARYQQSTVVSETNDTANPWELEYMPNPVIFAHLANCFSPSSSDEHSTRSLPQMHSLRGLEVISENAVLQHAKRKMGDSSDVTELEEHVEAAAANSSRAKRRAYSRESTKEPNTSVPGLFSSDGGDLLPQSHSSDPPSLVYTTHSSPAHTQPEPEQSSSDQSQESSPASTSIVDDSTPESSAPSDGDQSLTCNECGLEFRTTGQRREHQNRKHIRRFKCKICNRAFHLRADLGRHERVVHKTNDMLGGHGECALKCPNEGCKTASKVWDRKDNLARHFVRCRKALGHTT
jgi:hypothetical protein